MLKRLARSANDDEAGQMAIAMIITMLIVFVLFGLSADTGIWYFDHRLAQNQAEAAALAGALELPDTSAAAIKRDEWLGKNGSTVTQNTCPNDVTTDYVRVCVHRPSKGVFTALSGIDFARVSASAKALRIKVTMPYALMAMNQTACQSFNVTATGTILNVQGLSAAAGTYTRSSCSPNALDVTNGAQLRSSPDAGNDVVGSARCTGTCDPAPTTEEFLEDPFANVPIPPISGCGNAPNPLPTVLAPGCYTDKINVGNNKTLKLQPGGIYVLKGGLNVSSGGKLTGDQTGNGLSADEWNMFYVTCDGPPCTPSQAFSNSGGITELKGNPSLTDPYFHLSVFVDRNFGPGVAVDLSGGGIGKLEGAVYAISSTVKITGGSGTTNLQIAVVADQLTFSGGGTVNVQYDVTLLPPEYRLALTE